VWGRCRAVRRPVGEGGSGVCRVGSGVGNACRPVGRRVYSSFAHIWGGCIPPAARVAVVEVRRSIMPYGAVGMVQACGGSRHATVGHARIIRPWRLRLLGSAANLAQCVQVPQRGVQRCARACGKTAVTRTAGNAQNQPTEPQQRRAAQARKELQANQNGDSRTSM